MSDLARALGPYRDAERSLRWVARDQWHVTLSFLAAVPAPEVEALVAGLDRVAAVTPPLRLALAGAGAFPRADRARVVWAGLDGDTEALRRLAEGCQAAAAARGIEIDPKPFHAHLTVARARRRPVRAGTLLESLASYTGPPWTATEVRLIHSRPGPGGSRYDVRATLPLARDSRFGLAGP